MTTRSKVIDKIREQLDWRGPTGKSMGHIVLDRNEAEVLVGREDETEGETAHDKQD